MWNTQYGTWNGAFLYLHFFIFLSESCLEKVCAANEDCEEDSSTGEARCACPRCLSGQVREEQVCGSDGITYFSGCHLRQAACAQGQRDLLVRHQGPCGEFSLPVAEPTGLRMRSEFFFFFFLLRQHL